jgi:hypothetical protein
MRNIRLRMETVVTAEESLMKRQFQKLLRLKEVTLSNEACDMGVSRPPQDL